MSDDAAQRKQLADELEEVAQLVWEASGVVTNTIDEADRIFAVAKILRRDT